jgi:hypothetical protein
VLQLLFVRYLGGLLEGTLVRCFHGLKLGLMFAAPIKERRFGDVKLIGNGSDAPALDAEVEELIYGFDRVHI